MPVSPLKCVPLYLGRAMNNHIKLHSIPAMFLGSIMGDNGVYGAYIVYKYLTDISQ